MRRETKMHLLPVQQWRAAVVMMMLVTAGGMESATAWAAAYSLNEPLTRTLTVSQGETVIHTLTPVSGLTEGSVPITTVLANGTFSSTATKYAFKWDERHGDECGTTLKCSRISSQENANNYIDVVALFSGGEGQDDFTNGYTVVDLGNATAGTYSLANIGTNFVKAGTYRMKTTIGVYTP